MYLGKPLPIGALKKPEKRPPKEPKPLRRTPFERGQTPIAQSGKVSKQRAADKRAKLKAEPADHSGRRTCYLCLIAHDHVDLEHVIDASVRPDLRSDPRNHKWACNPCNLAKKNGMLTMQQEIRLQNAIEEVLSE